MTVVDLIHEHFTGIWWLIVIAILCNMGARVTKSASNVKEDDPGGKPSIVNRYK